MVRVKTKRFIHRTTKKESGIPITGYKDVSGTHLEVKLDSSNIYVIDKSSTGTFVKTNIDGSKQYQKLVKDDRNKVDSGSTYRLSQKAFIRFKKIQHLFCITKVESEEKKKVKEYAARIGAKTTSKGEDCTLLIRCDGFILNFLLPSL